MTKRCPKCGKTKPVAAFNKNRCERDGLQRWCKACMAACSAKYYQANREERLAYTAKYYRSNPDKCRAYAAKYRQANPDKVRAATSAWQKAHPEKIRATNARWGKANPDVGRDKEARRRAAKLGAGSEKVQRSVVYDRDMGFCHICGRAVFHDNWHLDHIVPLSKGGEHSYRNVAVSHPLCNMRKAAGL